MVLPVTQEVKLGITQIQGQPGQLGETYLKLKNEKGGRALPPPNKKIKTKQLRQQDGLNPSEASLATQQDHVSSVKHSASYCSMAVCA